MSHPPLQLRDCVVDLDTGVVSDRIAGGRRGLTTRELELLRYLVSRAGETVQRDTLMTEVWGYADRSLSRACDSTLHRLRRKIEPVPGEPVHLITVFGDGYRFVPVGPASAGSTVEPAPEEGSLIVGALRVELARHRVIGPTGEASLTAGEVELIRKLAAAGGAVVERAALGGGRRLDNTVHRLRAKLEPDPETPRFLITERGGGYRLAIGASGSLEEPGTSLIGRDLAEGEVEAALRSSRWVVLIGPGGMGKTRLARRVAARRAGVVWVDLTAARGLDQALGAVTQALGLSPTGDVAGAIGDALALRGRGLVVLDNLEGLVDGLTPCIAAWRDRAPEIRLLGTSRVRLGLDQEVAIELMPLAEADGVALFLERARAVSSGFAPRGGELETIRALVSALDGLPLAIELAAARVGLMRPAELLTRLDRRLDLLARPRGEVARHRSLRAALAGSWDLASEVERDALEALAMFPGGFSLDDAEGLLGRDGLDRLQALRDHSLVHRRPDGASFGVYEAIREFVAERRGERPDRGRAVELGWARWVAGGVAPALIDRLHLRAEAERAAALVRRVDDLESAVDVATTWGEPELAAAAALAAGAVRRHHGPAGPMRARLAGLVSALSAYPTLAARLGALQADLLRLADLPEEALDVVRRTLGLGPDPATESALRATAARALSDLSRFAEAVVEGERAADLCPAEHADRAAWLRATAHVHRTFVAQPLDGAPALAWFEEAAQLAARSGDRLLEGDALQQLARFDQANGRPRLAWDRYAAARQLFAELQVPVRELEVLRNSMVLQVNLGELVACEATGQRALELCARTGSAVDEATVWTYLATARVVGGDGVGARAAALRARAAMRRTRPLPRTEGYLELREAELALAEGDAGSAEARARSALGRFRAIEDLHNVARAEAVLGRALAAQGRTTEALDLADRAVAALVTHDPQGYAVPPVYAARGMVRLLAGDARGARDDLDAGESLARSIGLAASGSESALALGRLRAALAT